MYETELKELSKAEARYLVIGAIALGLHGYPRATFDLDIMPDLGSENLDKIVSTLTNLGYVPRAPVNPNAIKDPKKREEWYKVKNLRVFSFIDPKNPINIVDLMIYYSQDFEEYFKKRRTIEIDGVDICIASVADLLELKRKAMWEKDLNDITVLERMVEKE